jgi:DNA-directed RNA polymerase specialized sigma subunit
MPHWKRYNRRRCSLGQLPLDHIADPKTVPPGDDDRSQAREVLRILAERLVSTLKAQDAFIIRSLFGFGEVESDRAAIARQLGITRQAVSKRCPVLLKRLRRAASICS